MYKILYMYIIYIHANVVLSTEAKPFSHSLLIFSWLLFPLYEFMTTNANLPDGHTHTDSPSHTTLPDGHTLAYRQFNPITTSTYSSLPTRIGHTP